MSEEELKQEIVTLKQEMEEIKNLTQKDTFAALLSNATKNVSSIDAAFNKSQAASGEIETHKNMVSEVVKEISRHKKDVASAKNKLTELQNTWNESFKEKLDEHTKLLRKLHNDKEQELQEIITKNEKELTDLTQRINDLLPGATSVALASAFADRKNAVEKYKWVWAGILILSTLTLIAFGLAISTTLFTVLGIKIELIDSIYGRLMVIVGLIFLGDFARRNFNIVSRLAESYAYKEAIAKSYLGYKEQLENVKLPIINANGEVKTVADINGDSELVRIFLEKLNDEPGKHVFDKEINPVNMSELVGKSPASDPLKNAEKIANASTGLLTKITWQAVIAITIISTAVCALAYVFKDKLL